VKNLKEPLLPLSEPQLRSAKKVKGVSYSGAKLGKGEVRSKRGREGPRVIAARLDLAWGRGSIGRL